ncbi:MAG: radical SAM protein [Bacteroidales bacterium]|nr:radical SAM protein [Bacteroidales bacterium]
MTSSKKYKLLLVNPRNRRRVGLSQNRDSIYPPMALGIIAALTPENWEIEIADENFEDFTFRQADLVGITALTATINRAYEIAGLYRENGIPTILGGIHVSMLPGEASQYADCIVKGEAESVWPAIIADFISGRLQPLYEGKLLPLVNSPSPRIDLYNKDYEFGSVQTTRGCPMACDFCSVHTFNGNCYRTRPIDEVLRDLEQIPQRNLYFIDDNLVGHNKAMADRAIKLFKGMVDRGIEKDWWCSTSLNVAENEQVLEWAARSGCQMMFLGIESEDIEQLKAANKNVNVRIGVDHFEEVFQKLNKYGIAALGAFIYGLETDTPDKMKARTDYIIQSGIDAIQATLLTPLPGTLLFDRYLKEGRIVYNNFPKDWERYHYAEVVFKPLLMEDDELEAEVKKNWARLYDLKHIKRRMISSLKKTRNPTAAIWSLTNNIQLRNLVFENETETFDLSSFLNANFGLDKLKAIQQLKVKHE